MDEAVKSGKGFWRAHQIPILDPQTNPENLAKLEAWLRSYKPEELFDESGRFIEELREMAPVGTRRMTANPHANGSLSGGLSICPISAITPSR